MAARTLHRVALVALEAADRAFTQLLAALVFLHRVTLAVLEIVRLVDIPPAVAVALVRLEAMVLQLCPVSVAQVWLPQLPDQA